MSQQPPVDRQRKSGESSAPRRPLVIQIGKIQLAIVIALIVLVAGIGGHMYGQHVAFQDMQGREQTIQRLEIEDQRRSAIVTSLNGRIAALQTQLANTEAALNAIRPEPNTYNLNPNQSVIVGGGHLTIGLVGIPANDSIKISINGKQQSAVAGETIKVALDPSTDCRVKVQSFDMFTAQINVSCAASNSQ